MPRQILGDVRDDGTPDPSCDEGYPNLWRRLNRSTETMLVDVFRGLKEECRSTNKNGVDNKKIAEIAQMNFFQLKAELNKKCREVASVDRPVPLLRSTSKPQPRQQVMLPPEGECQQYRATFGYYRGVYIKLKQDPNEQTNGLFIWDDRADATIKNRVAKETSIPDLTGYTVNKDADESVFMKVRGLSHCSQSQHQSQLPCQGCAERPIVSGFASGHALHDQAHRAPGDVREGHISRAEVGVA